MIFNIQKYWIIIPVFSYAAYNHYRNSKEMDNWSRKLESWKYSGKDKIER